MSLSSLAAQYGYVGVAVTVFVEGFGVPAPGETAIIAGAAAAGHGKLNIVLVAVVAFLAAVCGDSIGYLIGRLGGRRLVLRYGRVVRLTPERFAKVEDFVRRRGPLVVAGARFVEGLRQLNGLVAGASGMPWPRFVLFNAIGAALWVGVWATGGYLAGDHWASIERYEPYLIVVLVLVIVFLVIRRLRRKSRD